MLASLSWQSHFPFCNLQREPCFPKPDDEQAISASAPKLFTLLTELRDATRTKKCQQLVAMRMTSDPKSSFTSDTPIWHQPREGSDASVNQYIA